MPEHLVVTGYLRTQWDCPGCGEVCDAEGEEVQCDACGGGPEQPPPGYRVLHLSDDPDDLLPETLYAIGENGHLWHVMLICPCGCGATIALNVLPDDSPRWRLHEHVDGPTLTPSVWRTAGCRSHFIHRRGQVIWCHK